MSIPRKIQEIAEKILKDQSRYPVGSPERILAAYTLSQDDPDYFVFSEEERAKRRAGNLKVNHESSRNDPFTEVSVNSCGRVTRPFDC